MRMQLVCIAISLLLLGGDHGSSVHAFHVSDELWSALVFVLFCDHDPGVVTVDRESFPPAGCTPAEHGSIQLKTMEDYLVDSCFFATQGICELTGRHDTNYRYEYVGWEIPEGFEARDNPGLFDPDDPFGSGIVFVPAAIFTPNETSASVTFHSRDCPLDYGGTDKFLDCHGTAARFSQTVEAIGITRRTVSSDRDVNGTIPVLDPGTWRFEPSLATDTASVSVFCSDVDTPGIERDITRILNDSKWFQFTIELRPGDNIVCDIYRTPGSTPPSDNSLLTLRMKSSQKLESPEQIYKDCFGNRGEDMFQMGNGDEFYLDGYTGPDGTITLQVPPGSYWASGIYGHNIAATYPSVLRVAIRRPA